MTPLPPKQTEDEVERARALIQDIEAWGLGKAVTEPGVTHLSAMDRAAITLSAALQHAEDALAKAVGENKALREAAEKAYGCLWAGTATEASEPSSKARALLLAAIGGLKSEGQRRGVQYATDRYYIGPEGTVPKQEAEIDQRSAIAGWNACRLSIYAVCEDVREREALTYKTEGSEHAEGFVRGMRWTAKSIARGFGAMEAMDDDNVRAALSGVQT